MSDSTDPTPVHATTTASATVASPFLSATLLKNTNHRTPSHLSLPSPPLSPQKDRSLSQHYSYGNVLAAHSSPTASSSDDDQAITCPNCPNTENYTNNTLHTSINDSSNDPRSASSQQLASITCLDDHALFEPLSVPPIRLDSGQPQEQQQEQQQENTLQLPLSHQSIQHPSQAHPHQHLSSTLSATTHLPNMDGNDTACETLKAESGNSKNNLSNPLRIHTKGLHRNTAAAVPVSFAAGFYPLHNSNNFDNDNGSQTDSSPSTPLRPSQLRKHHESLKLLARQELQADKKQDKDDDAGKINKSAVGETHLDRLPSAYTTKETEVVEEINLIRPRIELHFDNDHNNDDDDLMSPTTYHAQGALIRAKSYSMFESSPYQRQQQQLHEQQQLQLKQQQLYQHPAMYPYQPSSTFLATSPPPPPSMDTRDWIKMQVQINSLEQQVSHVSRTNQLLNQELDKVHGHLEKLTREEGEGWRREYEFLVQQVDLMHRQLSSQYYQYSAGRHPMLNAAGNTGDDGTNMTRVLQREVRELSDSLRKWQAAFKEADERYRKKCDGERVLKQTLQEREQQLISLVDKLSGYEYEFRRSLSNYEELMRLSQELQALEGKYPENVLRALESAASSLSSSAAASRTSSPPLALLGAAAGTPDTTFSEDNHSISPYSLTSSPTSNGKDAFAGLRQRLSVGASVAAETVPTNPVCSMEDANVETGDHMPGTFPVSRRSSVALPQSPPVDHLSVSILSWAALLATYMMS